MRCLEGLLGLLFVRVGCRTGGRRTRISRATELVLSRCPQRIILRGIWYPLCWYHIQGIGTPAKESNTRTAADKSVRLYYNNIVVLDYEDFLVGPDRRESGDSVAHSQALKLRDIAQWFKSEQPTLKAGFFEMVPLENPKSRSIFLGGDRWDVMTRQFSLLGTGQMTHCGSSLTQSTTFRLVSMPGTLTLRSSVTTLEPS